MRQTGGKIMRVPKLDGKALDNILNHMISTVDNSKGEIYEIGEHCQHEFAQLSSELESVRTMVLKVITDGEELDLKARESRKRLSDVSSRFKEFTEEQVRAAYEQAHTYQVDLTMNRELEKQLRKRRDDLERRLINLKETIDRAENLVSQITVVLHYLTSDLQDVSEVLDMYKQKQDFGFKIIEAQEAERKKLSREIHDGPAQMLANVMVRSDLTERIFRERGPEEALLEIKSLKQMVRSALAEVRRIIYDLRPMALDDLGLIPTLRKYLQTIGEYNSEIDFKFQIYGQEKRLEPNYEVALFRLAQEAVQNAIKHANASLIQVKLELLNDKGTLTVRDNGRGFEPHKQKEGSFGIMGMNERVETLEGEMTIQSSVGGGTLVYIQIPLKASIIV